MAKYVQLTADLSRAAINASVCRDLLVALEYVALAERTDAPYGEVKRAFAKLKGAGIDLELDDLIGSLLAERARTNRKRSKISSLDEKCHGTNISKGKGKMKQEEEGEEKGNEFLKFVPGGKP